MWSVIEGTEKASNYRADCDDRVGTVLHWDGAPVVLPTRPTFQSWTEPSGARSHITVIPFENGWIAEIRFEEAGPASCVSPTWPTREARLTLGGSNRRALAQREAYEAECDERGEPIGDIGDEWDFSYLKTGYDNPHAYLQWWMHADNEATAAALLEEGPWASVADITTLIERLDIIATTPSYSGRPDA